ncbi:MAG: hypothetical protein AAB270_09105 [Chloroflexota bacterium]
MRKNLWLRILLAVGLALGALAPAGAALARGTREPFSASGPVLTIDQGTVFPAGYSGRFVVVERTVSGELSGDLNGPFTFVYGSNVPISTQSGQVHGRLSVGAYEAAVEGKSSLLLGPGIAIGPDGGPLAVVVILGVSGSLAFTSGAQGQGDFTATVTAAIDPTTGHILFVVPSGFPILDLDFQPIGLTSSEAVLSGSWSG